MVQSKAEAMTQFLHKLAWVYFDGNGWWILAILAFFWGMKVTARTLAVGMILQTIFGLILLHFHET